MKLKPMSVFYVHEDEAGYKMEVNSGYDPEFGWSASVTFSSFGMKTAQASVQALQPSVEAFLKQLQDVKVVFEKEDV